MNMISAQVRQIPFCCLWRWRRQLPWFHTHSRQHLCFK